MGVAAKLANNYPDALLALAKVVKKTAPASLDDNTELLLLLPDGRLHNLRLRRYRLCL